MTNWFQTDECFDFYSSISFFEPFKFEVKRGSVVKGRIVGYIQKDGGKLKQFFSKRAIVNGGPMLAEDITEVEISELLSLCKTNLKGKAIYIETRNFINYSNYIDFFAKFQFKYCPHYDILIDTTNFESVFMKMDRNRKRNIKRAYEKGIKIENNPSREDILAFYKMLTDLYSKKVKTPLVPFEFFDSLQKKPISNFIIVKNAMNVIVSGLVCIGTGNTLYALYACGKDSEFRDLSPSVIANYEAIKYASEHGYSRFDFMGAGAPGDGGYGVRDFKLKFGGELVEYGRFQCILNKPLYFIGKLTISLIKRYL